MPRIVETTVFTIDELSDAAKENARIWFRDTETLMRLSVLPDEAVLRNPDWVARALFVLRVLRPLRWFGLVECRGDHAGDRGSGMWRKTPLFDRFLRFDPGVVAKPEATMH